jgi:toxin ParE1/3/4
MTYRIERTAKAEEQLRDIILYRAELTGSAEAALALLDKLEEEINTLSRFPESGAPPRYGALRARGFRVLIVDKFLVFYKIDHSRTLVTVYAVTDGRRDYLNLI